MKNNFIENQTIPISIILPVYNSQLTIKKCLRSIIEQTYSNYEIIIINDGSTDDTINIIKNYFSIIGFTEFEILNQKNSGPAKARNIGIEFSKYKIISFLDSDDYWVEWHLENLVYNYVESDEKSLICAKKGNFEKNGGSKIISKNKMLFKNYVISSTILLSKELLKGKKFNINQKYSEDYRLWLELVFDGAIIILLNDYSSKCVNDSLPSLSKRYFRMEIGEVGNYLYLFSKRKINIVYLFFASTFSFLKFIFRIVTVLFRKLLKVKNE